MSLVNELKAKSENIQNRKQEIIEEIKNCFDKYLNGNEFENFIERKIGKTEIEERKLFMMVEFWEYHDGCSTTYFSCGGAAWYNPENKDGIKSWDYKGIRLMTIQEEVCNYLIEKLKVRMKELGFDCLHEEDAKGRLGYCKTHFYFGW